MRNNSNDDLQELQDSGRDLLLDNAVNFLKKYKVVLVLAFLAVVAGCSYWFFYRHSEQDRLIALVDEYQIAHVNINSQKYDTPLTSLSAIVTNPELPDFYVYAATADMLRVYLGHNFLFRDLLDSKEDVRTKTALIFANMKESIEAGIGRVQDSLSRELLVTMGEFINNYREKFFKILKLDKIELPVLKKKYMPGLSNELMMFISIVQDNEDMAKEFAEEIVNSPKIDRYRRQRAESILLYLDKDEADE